MDEKRIDRLTSGHVGPKSAHGPAPPEKKKSRLRFKEELAPEATAPPKNIDPTTSGQVGPKSGKLKTDKEKARPSERLRLDGEAPASDSGGDSKPGKKAIRDDKKLKKSKFRMEQTGEKLNVAREKLAAQKPPKKPGIGKLLGKAAKFEAWKYAHGKIYQVEHENVGVEAAHKAELAGEKIVGGTVRFVKHRIRTRPARLVRKLTKRDISAKADYAYKKLVQDNPELQKKAVSRLIQKHKIKRQYAKQAREAAKHGKRAVKATAKVTRAVATFVKSNPKVLLIVLALFLIVVILQSCMASMIAIGNGIMGGIAGTSYLAEDYDINEAELRYTEWEADLQLRINNAERDNPGYDEYRYNVPDISHSPYELMAFLTAVYDDFTYSGVRGILQQIFNEQYTLSFVREVEVRYRTERRTGSYTDAEGNSHSYSYYVEVPYNYYILNINLTARSFTEIAFSRMNAEQLERHRAYMITKGNRQYVGSPFPFNWLPYVSSYYGYRVHPISGEKDLHTGADIALPVGTEIQAGGKGVVLQAGNNGGYGLTLLIDYGNGVTARYAHCSELLVRAGQSVEAGQAIAKVGNTGNSTGPHLHIEVIKNGQYLNPLYFVVTNDFGEGPTYGDPGTPMGDGSYAALIAEAERHLGKPYVFGANGPNSFDCSSFVCWVFTKSGVYNLPRTTAQGIYNQSTPVSPSEAQPGDLIFFTGTYSTPNAVSHIGIYVGNGMMIHAGSPIQYTNINTSYWQSHFYSFGRLGN